jgi:hypothetical protein
MEMTNGSGTQRMRSCGVGGPPAGIHAHEEVITTSGSAALKAGGLCAVTLLR